MVDFDSDPKSIECKVIIIDLKEQAYHHRDTMFIIYSEVSYGIQPSRDAIAMVDKHRIVAFQYPCSLTFQILGPLLG